MRYGVIVMKKFLKIILIFLVIVVLGIAAVFYATADLPKAADDFFKSVKHKDMDHAYSLVSEDFKSGTSKDQLRQFLDENSMSNYASTFWDNRSINGDRGSLKGTLNSADGTKVPLEINFIKSAAGWKIYSIHKPLSGVSGLKETLQVPNEANLIRLVNETIELFGNAVTAQSMAGLFEEISQLWRRQTTVEQLDKAFDSFYGNPFDFKNLAGLKPAFTGEPYINDDGVLIISGFYPTSQAKLVFELKYFKEGLSWKLLGVNIELK